MWVKALMLREIRQARAMLWIVPIGHFFTLGLLRYNYWFTGEQRWIDQRINSVHDMLGAYQYGNFESGSRMFLMLTLFVLALIQLGFEKRNGVQEMLFSFPYSRRSVFVTKWLFGVGLLAASLLLNTFIDMVIFASSPVSSYFNLAYHANEVLYTLLSVTAIYSLAMLLGAISGSIASQSVFTFLVFILPFGIWTLVNEFIQVHSGVNPSTYYNWYYSMQQNFSVQSYLTVRYDEISFKEVVIMGLLLLITAWGGLIAYERSRTENNGKLLIFEGWERVMQVSFVACFALLSGMFLSSVFETQNRIVLYYIGLIAGLFLGMSIIRRLSRIRLKI
jgi:acetoin utilization transport system permease protein